MNNEYERREDGLDQNSEDRSRYEYHYSYSRDNQPGADTDRQEPPLRQPYQTYEPYQTYQAVPPTPPRRKKRGLRIAAGILTGVLLVGGSFGAGWFVKDWLRKNHVNETEIYYSERPAAQITTVSVNGKDKLTYPEIYAANVDSCVSINVSTTAGYNIFGQPVQSASSGSGFVITDDGYIVTNYHVISGATAVEVTMNDGTSFPAQVIGGDEDYDIAVIKVEPGDTPLKPVVLGTSESLLVGDDVIAIGNPLGELTFSMSEGIVSCLDREINVDGTPFNMIQITSAVNSGNSGGPLFNIYGEVVGIVSAKYTTSQSGTSVEGLGFAIPMDDVMNMIKDIMENGQVTTRPYMGISVADAAYYPQSGVSSGGYLVEVVENGPAAKAGLQVGDVITMIGTTTVSSRSDVTNAVGSKSYSAGDTVTITYVREGKVYTTELTFGSTLDAPVQEDAASQPQSSPDYPGSYYGYGGMEEFFERYFGQGRSYNQSDAA